MERYQVRNFNEISNFYTAVWQKQQDAHDFWLILG